jgi:hypothetical protein
MKITQYVEYIQEARRRGFGDLAIRNSLIEKGWPLNEIDLAFSYVQTLNSEEGWHEKGEIEREYYDSGENKIVLYIDDELLEMLEKRAKKNMLTLPQQVEDILRRSTLNQKNKKNAGNEKLDDNLVGIFSRKKTGPKSKKRKRKQTKKEEKKKIRKVKRAKRKAEKIEKKIKRKGRRKKKKKE